jgi:hypothetical protein
VSVLRTVAAPGSLAGAAFGWIVWSSAFVSLYALLSLGCAFGWAESRWGPASALTALLTGLWVAHLAALLWLGVRAWRSEPADAEATGSRRLLAFAARAGYVAALAGTVWLGFPILMLDPCA